MHGTKRIWKQKPTKCWFYKGQIMLLTNRFPNENRSGLQEYYCDLTREMDQIIGISPDQYWKHYVLYADGLMKKDKCLAIRIPGGTVGGIWINDENIIVRVFVNPEYYVIKKYPADINEKLAHFVGEKVEFTN